MEKGGAANCAKAPSPADATAASSPTAAQQPTIVGYSADPTQKENWENDFEDLDELATASGRFAPWGTGMARIDSIVPISPSSVRGTVNSDDQKGPDPRDISSSMASDDDSPRLLAPKFPTSALPSPARSALASPTKRDDDHDAGSSSSEGDWDNEIEQEDADGSGSPAAADGAETGTALASTMQKQVSSLLRSYLATEDNLLASGMLSTRGRTPSHTVIPRRHRLLRAIQSEDDAPSVKIVVYPKPSILYSEHTDEGRASFRESVLEEWLSMLGFNPSHVYLSYPPDSTMTLAIPQLPSNLTVAKLSEWLQTCMEHVHNLYRHRGSLQKTEQCWDASMFAMNLLLKSKFVLSDDVPEHTARPVFDKLYTVLYAAAKTMPDNHMDTYSGFVTTAVNMFPRYRGLLELLMLAAIAHTDATRLNRVLRNYVVVYSMHEDADTPLNVEVAVDALVSLHLYLNQYSPLNTSILTATASWDIADDPNVQWLEYAMNGCDITPDLLSVPAISPEKLRQEQCVWKLCGSATFRMELLEVLYARMSATSLLRAKCAYVMGHYALHEHNDTALAERLLFECVFLLDRVTPVLPSQVPLVSELGTNALIAYGDILLSNGKYKYAILALEAAVSCYKLRRGQDFMVMDRRLCDICTEARDWDRSLKYHLKILSTSRTQENVAEFVYISQQISKIYTDLGDWPRAEMHLLDALHFLSLISTRVSPPPVSPATHQSGPMESANSAIEATHNSDPLPANDLLVVRRSFNSDQSPLRIRESGTVGRYSIQRSIHHQRPRLDGAGCSRSVGRRSELMSFAHSSVNEVSAESTPRSAPVDSVASASSAGTASSNVNLSLTTRSRNRAARLGLYLRLAQLYISGGIPQEAVSLLQSVLDSDLAKSKTPLVKLMMAKACLKLGMTYRVSEILRELSDDDPGDPYASASSQPGLLRAPTNPFSLSNSIVSSPEFIDVQVALLTQREQYPAALVVTNDAIRQCTTSNLLRLARLHSQRAKLLYSVAIRQLHSLCLPSHSPPPTTKDAFWGLPDLNPCISAFSQAYEYFSKVNDVYRSAKMLSGIAQAYLDVLVLVCVVLKWPLEVLAPWMEANGFDMTSTNVLRRVEVPASQALDTFVECYDVIHLLSALLSIAELRTVQAAVEHRQNQQRDHQTAFDDDVNSVGIAYWKEVRDAFFHLFVDGSECVILRSASPGYRCRLGRFFSRLVRLLMTFNPEFISENTAVLDVFVLFQIDMDRLAMTGVPAAETHTSSSAQTTTESCAVPSEQQLSPTRSSGLSPSRPSSMTSRSISGNRSSGVSPSRTARLLTAGKKFTLGLRSSRNRVSSPKHSMGSGADVEGDDLLLYQNLAPKFSCTTTPSGSLSHSGPTSADIVDCLCQVHRNCILFATGRLTNAEVQERNRSYVRRQLTLMAQRQPEPALAKNAPLYSNLTYAISASGLFALFSPSCMRIAIAVQSDPHRNREFTTTMLQRLRASKENRSRVYSKRENIQSNSASALSLDAIRIDGLSSDNIEGNPPDAQGPLMESLMPALSLDCVNLMLSCLDAQNVIVLLAAVLLEQRVILASSSQNALVAVCSSLASLMYPFLWRHAYVPVVTRYTLSLVDLDCPYLIGIHSFLLGLVSPQQRSNAVVVDLDHNHVINRPPTLTAFPTKISSRLYKSIVRFTSADFVQQNAAAVGNGVPHQPRPSLRSAVLAQPVGTSLPPLQVASPHQGLVTLPKDASKEPPTLALSILIQGFVDTFASMLYQYRLQWDPLSQSPAFFNASVFVQDAKSANRTFLEQLCRTTTFASFLEERHAALPSTLAADLFERAVLSALSAKWTKFQAFESVSFSMAVYASHKGKKHLRKRWAVLNGRRLALFGSKRASKKTNARPQHAITLVPGRFTLVTPVDNDDSMFMLLIDEAGDHDLMDPIADTGRDEWRFRLETHDQRRQWTMAISARAVSDGVRHKWALLVKQYNNDDR
ncbi:UDENN domain-containing protein [Plasmodiophora brassicae]|uniref:UDENN domain-containing protein n=1 Tax=Plasmodiophora brassicae TaxID=37360 RepID=A0A0G4IJL5_PLABS|nr:hypothetical protein PBRA_004036 [Plasmodiophora brassicae]